jgi:hypothetical protein
MHADRLGDLCSLSKEKMEWVRNGAPERERFRHVPGIGLEAGPAHSGPVTVHSGFLNRALSTTALAKSSIIGLIEERVLKCISASSSLTTDR